MHLDRLFFILFKLISSSNKIISMIKFSSDHILLTCRYTVFLLNGNLSWTKSMNIQTFNWTDRLRNEIERIVRINLNNEHKIYRLYSYIKLERAKSKATANVWAQIKKNYFGYFRAFRLGPERLIASIIDTWNCLMLIKLVFRLRRFLMLFPHNSLINKRA